jgi:hypothetical protein
MEPSDSRRKQPAERRGKAPPVIVAEKQPLITYTDPADSAWKAKIEGDRWPEPPRSNRLPMTIAAVASLIFLAAFFGARQAAVAALPDLGGLYAAIGMPVNLEGLAIEKTVAERKLTFDGARITLRATLRNLGPGTRTIPQLVALVDDGVEPVASFRLDPPQKTIAGRSALPLVADLGVSPDEVKEVTVRFLRPGETPPDAAARLVAE